LNGEAISTLTLLETLNTLAGNHGVGRIDMIENRLVGIKSREIYEAPALLVLIAAHRDLESLTLTADVTQYKRGVEDTYSRLVYNGLWYSPLKAALDGFIHQTQARVNGTVRVKLHKGSAQIVGRQSDTGLYSEALATYGREDQFDHQSAEGFIYVWGLPTRIWSEQLRQSYAFAVSHSHRRTKKMQEANLQSKRVWWPEGKRFVKLRLSTKAIKTLEKKGITAMAREAGINLAKY
jgi:argininosuccinate synthase